ncbi:hypothetical protein E2C01_006741 [Portunus trituberculatus]|uniref:Uncharacterized protein n=1 Tax=Portunus trituberculatus TaxID=210409 RepID=A0A5B7CXL2_PORTR|nr:hypothetical protein [Portunus trituberculatus]
MPIQYILHPVSWFDCKVMLTEHYTVETNTAAGLEVMYSTKEKVITMNDDYKPRRVKLSLTYDIPVSKRCNLQRSVLNNNGSPLAHLVCSWRRDIDNASSLLHYQVVDDAIAEAVLLLNEVIGVSSMWNSQQHAVFSLHLQNYIVNNWTALCYLGRAD